MALAKNKKTAVAEKLTIANRLGTVFISNKKVKQNTNGKDYIATPYGAVYANLPEIERGLYTAVELSNGVIALNNPSTEEVLSFINEKCGEYEHLTAGDIREMYEL